jgi:NAD(P)-dependent dehydrogenase (short-subunit alcohol dehydrogenase family)
MGGEAVSNGNSVADFRASAGIIDTALDAFGRLDIIVNNAGILRPNLIFDATEEDFDRLFDVHMKGTFNMTRHAAPIFRSQGHGIIINTGSDSGLGHYGP